MVTLLNDSLFLFSGVQAYADALLVIPKVLAINSGLDAQETIVTLQEEFASAGQPVGLDISSGKDTDIHYIILFLILYQSTFSKIRQDKFYLTLVTIND